MLNLSWKSEKDKNGCFEQKEGEYLSGNAGPTDDCARTCQLFTETKAAESQDGGVIRRVDVGRRTETAGRPNRGGPR